MPTWNAAHQTDGKLGAFSSQTFRSRFRWGVNGERVRDGNQEGRNYLLSTMLGVTSGRGNSVAEVIHYLSRAATADGTHPEGTIYLMHNSDLRSKVRHALFPETAAQLTAMGVRAKVLQGVLPKGKRDVAGLMVGAAEFDPQRGGIGILPGAICEHLTSYGGILKRDHYQTPLSEFLRIGAAGASGTVVEPRSRRQKFPLPAIHVHYARGCSLAESFYQSVVAPLQMLVVGDPLFMPWANAPKIIVEPPPGDVPLQGTVQFSPQEAARDGASVGVFLLYVDGKLLAARRPGEPISWDTTQSPDGHHEVRLVGIRTDSIATQGRATFDVEVDNHGVGVDLAIHPAGEVSAQEELTLTAQATSAEGLVFLHHERELGRVTGNQGQLRVLAADLGGGPVALRVRTLGPHPAVSAVVQVHVK